MNSSSGMSPCEELGGLRLEVVELPLEDRDHVPGHVLQDLGVLERAALGGGLGVLKLAPSCETS